MIFVRLKVHISNLGDILQLKKDLQEVAQAEADIAKLEHKVDDLENRLGHHDGKASGSTHSASKESRKLPEHNAKMYGFINRFTFNLTTYGLNNIKANYSSSFKFVTQEGETKRY